MDPMEMNETGKNKYIEQELSCMYSYLAEGGIIPLKGLLLNGRLSFG